MLRIETVISMIQSSKVNSFFSFQSTIERSALVEEVIELKNVTVLRLYLTDAEILKTQQESELFKKALENFLWLYNHTIYKTYPNISFTALTINGHKFPTCIILFRGKSSQTSQFVSPGYKKIDSLRLDVDPIGPYTPEEYEQYQKQIQQQKNELEDIHFPQDKRIYRKVVDMLKNKTISIRKIFALGMKQWQARHIYKLLNDIGLFEVDPQNNNEKIYHPERYREFTQEHITMIMNQQNPEDH